jgi:hypothetical protein
MSFAVSRASWAAAPPAIVAAVPRPREPQVEDAETIDVQVLWEELHELWEELHEPDPRIAPPWAAIDPLLPPPAYAAAAYALAGRPVAGPRRLNVLVG